VIDVGPADRSVDAKLVVTSSRPQEYLALSHCWGAPGPEVRMLRTMTSITWHSACEVYGRIVVYFMSLSDSQERVGMATFDQLYAHERVNEEEKFYALQVMVQSVPVRDPAGLILRSVGVEDQYERVGAFQVDAEHLDVVSMVKREILTLV
jgi:hypothetical protein